MESYPHKNNLPVIQRLITTYKLWYEFLSHFPKTSRYTLGSKIDALFIEIAESLIIASYLNRNQKIPYVRKAIFKLDLLKFFLQISWEIKSLDNKKFILLSEKLNEIGKMIGGWQKQLIREKPANGGKKQR